MADISMLTITVHVEYTDRAIIAFLGERGKELSIFGYLMPDDDEPEWYDGAHWEPDNG